MIMAPLLVEKLHVSSSTYSRDQTTDSFLDDSVLTWSTVGGRRLIRRYEEVTRFRLSYGRSGRFHAEEAAVYSEGNQRGEGGKDTGRR